MREAKELFTIVDIETTGLNADEDQIIELAAIQTDLEKEVGRLEMKVALKDGKTLPPIITELTGLTEDDLFGGYPEEFVAIMFGLFSAGTVVVAQNAPFDLSFLHKFGVRPDLFLCTRAMVKLAEPTESPSLKDVVKRWGIEYKGHHRAINDCEMTVQILKEAMKRLEEKGIKRIEYQNLVIDMPDRPLKFIPKGAQVKHVDEEGNFHDGARA
jgi:DNA polymerase III subunit epsilon